MKPNQLPKEIVAILLPRLKDEHTAHYFYRAASNWCKNVGYFVAAEYFFKESEDELTHAKKLEDFLVDWNVVPQLPALDKPKTEFKSLLDLIQQAYKIEYDLYTEYEEDSTKVAKTGDYCVFDLLQFFRTTQKESVAQYSDMLNLLEGVEDNKFNMLLLEKKLF
jgi:ferritin